MEILQKIQNFVSDEEGATAIEYGLIVALIAVVIIGGVTALGTTLSGMFTGLSSTVGSIATSS